MLVVDKAHTKRDLCMLFKHSVQVVGVILRVLDAGGTLTLNKLPTRTMELYLVKIKTLEKLAATASLMGTTV